MIFSILLESHIRVCMYIMIKRISIDKYTLESTRTNTKKMILIIHIPVHLLFYMISDKILIISVWDGSHTTRHPRMSRRRKSCGICCQTATCLSQLTNSAKASLIDELGASRNPGLISADLDTLRRWWLDPKAHYLARYNCPHFRKYWVMNGRCAFSITIFSCTCISVQNYQDALTK